MVIEWQNEEVIKAIQDLISKEMPEKIAEGLEKAGLVVERQAKVLCPVDDGQLRQSITHVVDMENKEVVIGTNVEYAPYVEVGTGIFSSQGNGRQDAWRYEDAKGEWHTTVGQKAQPFLEPAADETQQEILKAFEGVL